MVSKRHQVATACAFWFSTLLNSIIRTSAPFQVALLRAFRQVGTRLHLLPITAADPYPSSGLAGFHFEAASIASCVVLCSAKPGRTGRGVNASCGDDGCVCTSM